MTGQKTENNRQEGFTLLEVVVAITIVALGVVTLFEIFSQGLLLGARSSDRSEAMVYGQQIMDEFLTQSDFQDRRGEGTAGGKHRWRLTVEPLRDLPGLFSSDAWELKEITLEMRYWDGRREKQVEMKTLRLVKSNEGSFFKERSATAR